MDSISLHLDIQNSLNKTMKEVGNTTKKFNSLLEDSADKFENIDKTLGTIEDNYDEITESTEKLVKDTQSWGQRLSGVGNAIKNMLPGFGLIFGGGLIADVVGQTFELDTLMTKISFRMGEAGKSTQFLKDTVIGVAHETGIATERAMEFVAGLKRLRVSNQDIVQLSTDIARFAEITGAANDTVIRLAGELSRTGRLGQKSISGILAGIVDVQRAFGLTEGEVEDLSESIQYSTKMLNQMGKSAGFIESFAKGTTKLAAAFVQVGLSAQDANKFIEDLLDPGRLEDNALLYSRLGISIEDAISGNVDPGLLASKFKDLGAELKSMSGPAAYAMAESLGMPLNKLRQMAEMDISALEETFSGAGDASAELAAQQEEQLATQEKFEKTMNRIKNVFVDLADAFMPIIDQFATFIHSGGKDLTGMIHGWVDKLKEFIPIIVKVIKGVAGFIGKIFKPAMIIGGIIALFILIKKFKSKWKSMSEENAKATQNSFSGIKDSLANAMVEASSMAAEKSAIIMAKELPEKLRGKTIDLETRIKMGPAYEQTMKIADQFDQMAESNLFPFAKKFAKDTADTQRSLAMGAKPMSKLTLMTQENYKVVADKLLLMKEERIMTEGALAEREKANNNEQTYMQERLDYLNEVKGTNKEEANHQWEMEQIGDKIVALGKEQNQIRAEERSETVRFNDLEKSYIKSLSEDQLTAMFKEQEARKQIAVTAEENVRTEMSSIESRNDLIEKEMRFLIEKGNLSPKLEADYNKQLKQNKTQLEQNRNLLIESQIATEKITDEMFDLEKAAAAANKEIRKTTAQNPRFIKQTTKVWDFVKSVGSSLKTNMKNAWDKAKNSAKTIWKGFKENIKPANWMKALRKFGDGSLMKGLGKGLGKIAGGFVKIGGPLLLLGAAMGQMAPVQEAMARVMESIKPTLDNLKESFMKLLKGFAEDLVPVFTSLAKNILPAIMKIMKAIMPMFIMLVKMLLPPLLDVLAFLIDALGTVIVAIGGLVGMLDKTLGDNLKEFGEGLKDSASAMREAAGEMRISNANAETQIIIDRTRILLVGKANSLMEDGLENGELTAEATRDLKFEIQQRVVQVEEAVRKAEIENLISELNALEDLAWEANYGEGKKSDIDAFNEAMLQSSDDMRALGLDFQDFKNATPSIGSFYPQMMIKANDDMQDMLEKRITGSTEIEMSALEDVLGHTIEDLMKMSPEQLQAALLKMQEQQEINDNANTDQLTNALGDSGNTITEEMEPAMLRATADGGWEVEQKARVITLDGGSPEQTVQEETADATSAVASNTEKLVTDQEIIIDQNKEILIELKEQNRLKRDSMY